MKPLGARVLLSRKKQEKIGSILLAEESQERYASLKCEILALGPACEWPLEVGDQVLIGRHAGAWINPEGHPATDPDSDLFVVQEDDILVKL